MINLFQQGNFKLASGQKAKWKIECEALTRKDWRTLAVMAIDVLEINKIPVEFGRVLGVPKGGLPLAMELKHLETNNPKDGILIVEDVVTTGRSMERFKAKFDEELINFISEGGYLGLTVFARGKCPYWVYPIFQMPQETNNGK